ncbi:MAG: hypothetical protein ACO20X_14510, partial [Alphaproteobacteria bacterium]
DSRFLYLDYLAPPDKQFPGLTQSSATAALYFKTLVSRSLQFSATTPDSVSFLPFLGELLRGRILLQGPLFRNMLRH